MTLTSHVFFYGLFMDTPLLEAKGIRVTGSRPAVVRDYELRIGDRATMVPNSGHLVHGMITAMSLADVDRLYSEPSVEVYRPIAVVVEAAGSDAPAAALAYVLPESPDPDERNPEYASKLRALAERLGFPHHYTSSIT